MKTEKYSVSGHEIIRISPDEETDTVCYLTGDTENAEDIFIRSGEIPFILVCVKTNDWNRELSPWKAPKVFSSGEDFSGEAAAFLKALENDIIPFCENGKYSHRIISGYSLAGLFAVWAAWNCRLFDGLVSCSGSMWFDGFTEYIKERAPVSELSCAYFSLGDKEKKTRNKRMAAVESTTAEVKDELSKYCPDTVFRLVPGNHFTEPDRRLSDGISHVVSSLSGTSINQ